MSDHSTDKEARAAATLVSMVTQRGGLDQRKVPELLKSTTVNLRASRVEIDFGYLGETAWYEWDGDGAHLHAILEAAADNFSTTLQVEREKHGPTPWDA
jgi:hypothetical protein